MIAIIYTIVKSDSQIQIECQSKYSRLDRHIRHTHSHAAHIHLCYAFMIFCFFYSVVNQIDRHAHNWKRFHTKFVSSIECFDDNYIAALTTLYGRPGCRLWRLESLFIDVPILNSNQNYSMAIRIASASCCTILHICSTRISYSATSIFSFLCSADRSSCPKCVYVCVLWRWQRPMPNIGKWRQSQRERTIFDDSTKSGPQFCDERHPLANAHLCPVPVSIYITCRPAYRPYA